MEKTEHQDLKNLSQSTRYQFLMKITQLLLSVSVFTLLLWKFSIVSFLCSFNFYFSTVPVQLFSHTINKNCIFLLCNGLLVFVAKFSGLITSSPSKYNNHDNIDQSVKNYDQDYYAPTSVLLEQSKLPLEEKEELTVQENVVSLEERKENEVQVAEKQEESEVIADQENDEDQEEEKEFEDKFLVKENYQKDDQDYYEDEDDQEYYEDEDEEENVMLSTEELNKKFEEFIRKMKEEIRFEAQQQLVMVN